MMLQISCDMLTAKVQLYKYNHIKVQKNLSC